MALTLDSGVRKGQCAYCLALCSISLNVLGSMVLVH